MKDTVMQLHRNPQHKGSLDEGCVGLHQALAYGQAANPLCGDSVRFHVLLEAVQAQAGASAAPSPLRERSAAGSAAREGGGGAKRAFQQRYSRRRGSFGFWCVVAGRRCERLPARCFAVGCLALRRAAASRRRSCRRSSPVCRIRPRCRCPPACGIRSHFRDGFRFGGERQQQLRASHTPRGARGQHAYPYACRRSPRNCAPLRSHLCVCGGVHSPGGVCRRRLACSGVVSEATIAEAPSGETVRASLRTASPILSRALPSACCVAHTIPPRNRRGHTPKEVFGKPAAPPCTFRRLSRHQTPALLRAPTAFAPHHSCSM